MMYKDADNDSKPNAQEEENHKPRTVYLAPAEENSGWRVRIERQHEQMQTRTGYRLGTLRDGVLGEFTREDEADSCLDFPRGDGGLLRVGSEF